MPSAGCESPCRDLGGLTRTMAGAQSSQHALHNPSVNRPGRCDQRPGLWAGRKAADADPITHQPFDAEEERRCAEKRSASVRGGGGGGGGGRGGRRMATGRRGEGLLLPGERNCCGAQPGPHRIGACGAGSLGEEQEARGPEGPHRKGQGPKSDCGGGASTAIYARLGGASAP